MAMFMAMVPTLGHTLRKRLLPQGAHVTDEGVQAAI